MPLFDNSAGVASNFDVLGSLDYGNAGNSPTSMSDEEDWNSNPYARMAASQGLRGAFAKNPVDFAPGFNGSPADQGWWFGNTGDVNAAQGWLAGAGFQDGEATGDNFGLTLDQEFLSSEGITGVSAARGASQIRNGDFLSPEQVEANLAAARQLSGKYGDLKRGSRSLSEDKYELGYFADKGKLIWSKVGDKGNSTFWDQIFPTLILTGIAGAAGGAAGGGTIGGATSGGVYGGLSSAASPGGFSLDSILKGALLGGGTGAIAQGASSALDEWTGQMGNNPSAYRPGVLTQGQNQALSRAIANTGATAARGGDYKQAALSSLLPIAGQAVQPYLNQGVSELSSLFSGGNMTDDFNMPGGMSFSGGNSNLDDVLRGAGIGQTQGPMSTTSDWLAQSGGGGNYDFSSMFGGNGFQSSANLQQDNPYAFASNATFGGGDGMRVGAGPTSLSNAPSNINADDWSRRLREYIGSDAGRGAMRAFGILNPKYGQMLGALMPQQPGGKMSGIEAGLGALATLYASNRANKNLKQQIGGLQGLFGQDSPYAQQLRQTLSRKDAAAGRRSQYGPREVELQARLAELNSRNAPQLAQLYGAQDINRSRMLRDMLIYGQQSGLTRQIGDGLSSLFNPSSGGQYAIGG